jgi:hypothetical protein
MQHAASKSLIISLLYIAYNRLASSLALPLRPTLPMQEMLSMHILLTMHNFAHHAKARLVSYRGGSARSLLGHGQILLQ